MSACQNQHRRYLAIFAAVFALSGMACGGTWHGGSTTRYAATSNAGSTIEIVDRPSAPPAHRPILRGGAAAADSRVARHTPTTRGSESVRYQPMSTLGTYMPSQARDDHDGDHDHGGPRHDQPESDVGARVDGAYAPRVTADGIGFPYPTDKFFRGFGRCVRGNGHAHEAIDLGGVGPDWGVGTPIRSMGRAEIVFIGLGSDNPELFGQPDTRKGHIFRGRRELPRHAEIAPYGDVYFFTRTKGRWRSGSLIVTRVVAGPLAGHIVRYLHVAAVHPAAKVGTIVEMGQEIALMGGTGVQESAPHLHLDIETPDGHRVDVAPVLGLAKTASCEDVPSEISDATEGDVANAKLRKYSRVPTVAKPAREASRRSREAEAEDADAEEVGKVWVQRVDYDCQGRRWTEDFASGRYDSHAIVVKLDKGEKLDLALSHSKGKWKPAVSYSGAHIKKKPGRAKRGQKRLVLQATADTEVTLKIDAYRQDQPPKDAVYSLVFGSTCTGATRGR